jgi:hypothetical protein
MMICQCGVPTSVESQAWTLNPLNLPMSFGRGEAHIGDIVLDLMPGMSGCDLVKILQ